MLTLITGCPARGCDGWRRRDVLQVGTLGLGGALTGTLEGELRSGGSRGVVHPG